jgi:hypothetical protein
MALVPTLSIFETLSDYWPQERPQDIRTQDSLTASLIICFFSSKPGPLDHQYENNFGFYE